MKKIILSAVCVLLTFMLSGCSFELIDSGSLLRPPKTTGAEQEICEAINVAIGRQPLLRYPRSGEYRSSIVLRDIDGDAQDEAVAFYCEAAESGVSSFAIVDSIAGKWTVTDRIDGPGGSVDKLMFGDVVGDGRTEILISWSAGIGSSTKRLTVYSLKNGKLELIDIEGENGEEPASAAGCTDAVVFDIDNDGVCELVTAKLDNRTDKCYARMFKCLSDGSIRKLYAAGSCLLDSSVTRYGQFTDAMLDDNHTALVIDGVKDTGEMVTEVVRWDSAKANLTAPFNSRTTGEVSGTDRPAAIKSADIDGDGIMEFPRCELLPCFDSSSEEPFYVTDWYDFNFADDALAEVCTQSSVVNPYDGYHLIIPRQWDGLSVKYDSTYKILSFFTVKGELQTVTVPIEEIEPGAHEIERDEENGTATVETMVDVYDSELFRIRVFDSSETGKPAPNFKALAEKDGSVIAVLICDADTDMEISENIIKTCFDLMQ